MPRVIFKPSDELESSGNAAAAATTAETNDDESGRSKSAAIKKEVVENPGEQVFHRKSERRRVARDIFLVFEEQPSSRRGRGRAANRKQTRPKPKFGHLKVEEPKGLLRDIKNEPKCYLNAVCTGRNRKTSSKAIKVSNESNKLNKNHGHNKPIARVNPIFLWVKQDDTRIVEVRCEDYDKRNRIRITKTTNGWRAIPRTDPASSRIVKFFQTPLMKVKREVYEQNQKQNEAAADLRQFLESEMYDSHQMLKSDVKEIYSEEGMQAEETNNQKEKLKNRKKVNKDLPNMAVGGSVSSSCDVLISENKLLTSASTLAVDEHNLEEHEQQSNTAAATTISTIECLVDEQATIFDKAKEAELTAEVELAKTYQRTRTPDLQLCPKTGLFLPSSQLLHASEQELAESAVDAKNLLADLINENCGIDCNMRAPQQTEDLVLVGSLDADAKNLKDLLDDADLLQHCGGDNANSGVELIDSLVKRSCENNLIQETELLKDTSLLHSFVNHNGGGGLAHKDTVTVADVIPHVLMDAVSDPPKCLSFNEAGEIEGLNGELFQPHNFLETYDKQSTELIGADLPQPTTEHKLEDAPKDLSYKKREEVCPPPESRSQCAVTSSSDVLKSPLHHEEDDMPAEIETTTETIKNLILEQFIKLNALNTIPPTQVDKQQQSEPIDLGKHRETTTVNEVNNFAASTNFIETVVIDDDNSNEEPVKKRLRNTAVSNTVVSEQPPPLIDKDPDPLTQLQLLIRNSQWKVPDPILVPKDRLAAVLASPAREIPLLITTRPELRLPEAFAYPEIIQNPNILVISMAQLEAILKNEMDVEKGKSTKPTDNAAARKLHAPQVEALHHNQTPKALQAAKDINSKCSHVDSSLASDINAATLAVLNQMLWLPYFGQLSQEFLKTLKEPQSKYNGGLMPLYNHQFGLQQLDELYKNYVKHISGMKQLSAEPTTNHHNHHHQQQQQQQPATANYPSAIGAFQNPVELAIFQKLLQHQMHNFLNMNPLAMADSANTKHASNAVEPSSNVSQQHQQQRNRQTQHASSLLVAKSPSALAVPAEAASARCLKQLKANCDNSLTADAELHKYAHEHHKQQAHSSSAAASSSSLSASACSDNKPRLVCKSLSNLLEPVESVNSTSAAAAVPLVNLIADSGTKSGTKPPNLVVDNKSNTSGKNDIHCQQQQQHHQQQQQQQQHSAEANYRMTRQQKQLMNPLNPMLHPAAFELSRQRKRNINFMDAAEAVGRNSATDLLNAEANPALWHPLFGSNAKSGYSSPWQWTTVTATGE